MSTGAWITYSSTKLFFVLQRYVAIPYSLSNCIDAKSLYLSKIAGKYVADKQACITSHYVLTGIGQRGDKSIELLLRYQDHWVKAFLVFLGLTRS